MDSVTETETLALVRFSCYLRPMLTIHVGSNNPQKFSGVKDEFLIVTDAVRAFHARNVPSDVPDQPKFDEVILGAENRAERAAAFGTGQEGRHLGVGLESGLFGRLQGGRPLLYSQTICAIHLLDEGKPVDDPSRWIYGTSSGFTVPERIMHHIRLGHDLEQATRLAGYTESHKIGSEEGVIGILSEGRVTRRTQLREAVRNALFHIRELL